MKVLELTARAVLESNITSKMCFACGGPPSSGIGEHIIPKWLQNECNIFNEKLTLLNGTLIPYRKLTVPCCVECNTGFLSNIEKSAQRVFHRGSIKPGTDELTLARWLSKILIGILVKETTLAFDRTRPSDGSIYPAAAIDDFHQCHFIMQSARKKTSFDCLHSQFPFSLYFYKIPNYRRGKEFDLSTNLVGQSISIRVGQLGVLYINDGGLQMEVGPKGPFGLSGSELSEVQFREISARVHYKAALRDATHFYLTSENDDTVQVNQLHVRSFSGYLPNSQELQIFREWDDIDLSYAMAAYMRVERSEVFDDVAQTFRTTLGNLIANQQPSDSDQ